MNQLAKHSAECRIGEGQPPAGNKERFRGPTQLDPIAFMQVRAQLARRAGMDGHDPRFIKLRLTDMKLGRIRVQANVVDR